MKLKLLFLFLFCIGISAENIHSQDAKVSISSEQTSLKEVLQEIEKKTDYLFLYNQEEVNVNRQVFVKAKNKKVSELLAELFIDTDISYKVVGENIILMKKEKMISQQTSSMIKGNIVNENGEPMVGVIILEKGTTNGTTTDLDGNFSLPVSANSILQISCIGYKNQEIEVGNRTFFQITLEENLEILEEVVVVGYGTQKKINVTGSVASIQADELEKVSVSSSSNALTGRLPGLIAQQTSGQPGSDAASLSIRGFGGALVIVDGIESDFNNIDPTQIESVSILKDGAAAIYGSRAGNGVILVTTKRGHSGKPSITFNGTYTMQKPTYFQEPLNSGQYTTLLSERHLQSGQPENTVPYTKEQIQKYYEAKEPGFYNTDWTKLILRDYAPMQNYNLSLRGGSEAVKYYAFLGTMNQGSFWKHNGGDYKRYNFQSNLDTKVTDNLSLGFTISYIVDDINSTHRPQNGGGYLFADLYNNLPMFPDNLPDPTKIPYSGSQTGGALVQSNRELGGYTDDDYQTFTGSAALDYNVQALKGLSLHAFMNYKQVTHQVKSFARPVDLYTYNVDTEEYTLAQQFNSNSPLFQQKAETPSMTGQFSVKYNSIFKEKHDISAMFLYEFFTTKYNYLSARREGFTFPSLDQMFAGSSSSQSNDGSTSEMGRVSYVGRFNYGYMGKYLAELILRADASAKFSPESRWGYFPSISLGWRLSEESFMSNLNNLDNLKLRVSYGQSGNDGIGNFQYIAGYTNTLMPVLWDDTPVMGITARALANSSFSWEEMTIYNAGIDYSLFNQKLYGEIDVFYRKRSGILARRTVSLPSSFGAELPLENLNSQNSRGFEVKLGTSGRYNDFKWNVVANIAWQRTKWDHVEEIDYTDPDSKRIYQQSNQWADRTFGYKTDGLFTSQEQINNLDFSYPGEPLLKPGDVRYVDVNKDGVLDWKDQIEIGKSQTPNWTGGINISLEYKDFDFTTLLQGAFGFYKYVSLVSFTQTFFDNRWTEENNNPNAFIPRLGGSGPNYMSDRNYVKSDYLRVKNLSIGYTIPKSLTKKMDVESLRVYIGGTNLLTFSKLNKYQIDAEAPFSVQDGQPTTSYYPQQKTIMAGISLKF